ncbi:MAG TPA: hypothetical protein VIG99_03245 [Myxococcaceae bacterium]
MPDADLNEAEQEMLLAADVVVEEAQANVASAAASGDSKLLGLREMELKVAFEWAHLVREEVKAGMLR